jgi:hypothetical protein
MKLGRLILFAILSLTLVSVRLLAEQEDNPYVTGTVIETTKDHLKVSRVLSGKTEERVFQMTAQTKVEQGRLRVRARVTVRYVSDGNGDTATLIIIRTEPAKQKPK